MPTSPMLCRFSIDSSSCSISPFPRENRTNRMKFLRVLGPFINSQRKLATLKRVGCKRGVCTYQEEDPELGGFMGYLDNLKNYEKCGVPRGAGTDSEDGFDLGRMNRLMGRLGNPHSRFKVGFYFLHFF